MSRKTFLWPILLLSLALCLACRDAGPPAEPLPTLDLGSAAERAADNAATAAGAAGAAAVGAAAEMTDAADAMAEDAAASAEGMLDRLGGVQEQAAEMMDGGEPTAEPMRLPTLTPTPEGMDSGLGLPDLAGLPPMDLATRDMSRYLEELEKRKVTAPVPLASEHLERFRHRFSLQFTLPPAAEGGLPRNFVSIEGFGAAVGSDASSCEVTTAAFGLLQETERVLIPGPAVTFYSAGTLDELAPQERWSPQVSGVLENCFHSAEFWTEWGALEELEGQEYTEEMKNGVLTRVYDLREDAAALPLEGMLGGGPGLPPGADAGSGEGTGRGDGNNGPADSAPDSGDIDKLMFWVAVDGGYPVAMEMDLDLGALGSAMLQGMAMPAEAGVGNEGMRLVMTGEIYDVNDPAIAVSRAEAFLPGSGAENSQAGTGDSDSDSGAENGDSGSDSGVENGAAGTAGAEGSAAETAGAETGSGSDASSAAVGSGSGRAGGTS